MKNTFDKVSIVLMKSVYFNSYIFVDSASNIVDYYINRKVRDERGVIKDKYWKEPGYGEAINIKTKLEGMAMKLECKYRDLERKI